MGEQYRGYLRERYLDLVDWVDIRPDINMTWCMGFVAVIGALFFAVPAGMMVIVAFMALVGSLFALAAAIGLAVLWVTVRAFADAWQRWRMEAMRRDDRQTPLLRRPSWQ